uniref:ChaB1 n=1 Tax=Spodoptera frugiperda nuclear polyhedrosis virus TaxID=10455 RepID=A0A0R5RHU8_NPVSF|nr:hypothetical protein [Spodoptera frugiperda multiple nucleopolyhedrovirus]QED40159.1 hypothetical protein [Spodoptera frugiperda multiple nucleopolyhedrovirus]
MFHLNEAFYHEEMPARAKRLFVKTFKKYHKLDGGDEDVALHMAKQAVDREYVKLNNRWIPKTAAEEIVRHDLEDDSLSESETPPSPPPPTRSNILQRSPAVAFRHNNNKNNNVNQYNRLNHDDEDDDMDFLSDEESDDTDEYDYDEDDHYNNTMYRKKSTLTNRNRGNGGGNIKQQHKFTRTMKSNNKQTFK